MEKGAKSEESVFKDMLPKRNFGVVQTERQAAVLPAAIKPSSVGIPENAKELQDKYLEQFTAFYETQKERAAQFIDEFGGIVNEGFIRIFSGDVLGGITNFFGNAIGSVAEGFKAFTLQWMKSQNVFIMFQAKIYAFYGKIMAGLAKFLGNPFTAGFAALGIAAGLSALSRTLGGSGGSSANTGTGFNPNIGAANTQTRIGAMNTTGNITINFPDGLIDMSNPATQRSFTKLINDVAGNRGLNLAGA